MPNRLVKILVSMILLSFVTFSTIFFNEIRPHIHGSNNGIIFVLLFLIGLLIVRVYRLNSKINYCNKLINKYSDEKQAEQAIQNKLVEEIKEAEQQRMNTIKDNLRNAIKNQKSS